MEAAEIATSRFWADRDAHVFAPSRLAKEGAEIEALPGVAGAIVFASSGSSGTPKWIRFRREALLASAEMVNRHLEVCARDTWMLALPLFHVGGFGVAARAYAAGCRLCTFPGKWNAMRFAGELEEAAVTLTSLVPTQVHDLVACDLRAPASLRAAVVGGASLDEGEGQAARDLGWPVLQSYGMTEAASQIATAELSSLRESFCAQPLPILPEWETRVDERGCLQLRGDALCDGYLRPEGGELQLDCAVGGDGWFATSDLVTIDSGQLTVVGRADRRLKILGEMVDVDALELDLRAHLARGTVLHVLPLPDERRGWRLVPMIETESTGAEDVVAIFNTRLPGCARLEAPRFVSTFPRTALGKVDAAKLREEVARPGDSVC